MTNNAYLNDVTFEIRYEKDGRKYKWTGRSTADIRHEAFYDEVELGYSSRLYPTHREVTVTLENVQEFKGVSVGLTEDRKFFIDELPEAPFDHYWELWPVYEERTYTFYPTGAEQYHERVPGKWELKLMDHEGNAVLRQTVNSLHDKDLSEAAKKLVDRYVSRNRARALEEGPVKLA